MKKILIIATALTISVVANAASFSWGAANIYGPDGVKLSGATAYLYCDALSSDALTSAVTSSAGAISSSTTAFNVDATAEQDYTFYFVITTNYQGEDYTFTSPTKTVMAQATSTQSIAFGNMSTASQASGAWTTAAVPEPTSGLLMLLGMAGLALRRRRA